MTTLAPLRPVNVEYELDQLAARADAAYRRAREAGAQMLRCAVECGEALLEAQLRVPDGEFDKWLARTTVARTTAYKYMRLARNAELVLAGGTPTLEAALALVAESADSPDNNRLDEAKKKQIARLAREGWSLRRIAAHLGLPRSVVWYWASPASQRRSRRVRASRQRRAERRAFLRQQREQAVERAGGSVAEGYSSIRRAAQQLDRAEQQFDDPEIRAAIQRAISRLHAAEDEILQALGRAYGVRS